MKSQLYIFFLVATIACKPTANIKDGATAYDLKKYSIASEMLQQDLSKTESAKDKTAIMLKIAKSYDYQNKFEQSEIWYQKIYLQRKDLDNTVMYVRALMRNEKYKEAQTLIDNHLVDNRQDKFVLSPMITTIQEALKGQQQLQYFVVDSLKSLNTDAADYAPFLYQNTIYFTSHQLSGKLDEYTGEGYADIRKMDIVSPDYNKLKINPYPLSINSPYHDAEATITENGKYMYFTKCGIDSTQTTDYCHIYYVVFDGIGWSSPIRVNMFADTVNEGQAAISPDGKELLFSSDFREGYGGRDLYISRKLNDTSWSFPQNLGVKINTTYNEMFPVLGYDGKLFFASDKSDTYGGLDVYSAERQGKSFANVIHLPYGINSCRDDFGWFPLLLHKDSIITEGYIASNRKGGSGNDDIYFITQRIPPPPPIPPTVFKLRHFALENSYSIPDNPNSKIIEKLPLDGVYFELFQNKNLIKSSLQNEGIQPFMAELDSNQIYKINLTKQGYLSAEATLNTYNAKYKQGDTLTFTLKTTLSKIYKNVEIVLENIYYDYDKWDIRTDATPTLDSLVDLLLQNPSIQIELASHTDSRGTNEYNQDLSQKRAESAVQYLISKGINAQRLTAKGYGESKPMNRCIDGITCTEEEYQQNRRTTFKILEL